MQEEDIAQALARIGASLEASGAPGADSVAIIRHALDELLAIHGLAGQLAEVARTQKDTLERIGAQLVAHDAALKMLATASADERMAINLLLVSLAELMKNMAQSHRELVRAVGDKVKG